MHPRQRGPTVNPPWYSHPSYQRFWTHYTAVMSWSHQQRESYHNAQINNGHYYRTVQGQFATRAQRARFPSPSRGRGLPLHTLTSPTSSRCKASSTRDQMTLTTNVKNSKTKDLKRKRVVTPESLKCKSYDVNSHEGEGEGSDAEVEEMEMEISQSMEDFFKQSRKHRESRGRCTQV